VSSALLTATITFDAVDREAAARSVACHWSQATAQEQARNMEALEHLWQGAVTFQQWAAALSAHRSSRP